MTYESSAIYAKKSFAVIKTKKTSEIIVISPEKLEEPLIMNGI